MAGIPSIGTLIYLLLGGVVAGILASAASFSTFSTVTRGVVRVAWSLFLLPNTCYS